MTLAYELWDVFTTRALAGNPLAVLPRAEGLTGAQMQRVAREFNLSETSFVLGRGNGWARARYFTPARELPVAGHPSIGTIYALHGRGEVTGETFTLELTAGPRGMRLEREAGALTRVWMNQGVPELGEVFDRARVAAALGLAEGELEPELPVQLGSAGVPFLYVPVVSLEALAHAGLTQASLTALMDDDPKAVFVFTRRAGGGADVRARMLGLALGVVEDPATGSAHGPLGAYLAAHGALPLAGGEARFVSHQGVEMGRPSEIHVRLSRGPQGLEVEVGGAAVKVAEGKLFL